MRQVSCCGDGAEWKNHVVVRDSVRLVGGICIQADKQIVLHHRRRGKRRAMIGRRAAAAWQSIAGHVDK